MKMKLEIYRKRATPNGFVVDEKAETTITNIAWYELDGEYIHYCYVNNHVPLTLHMDKFNYKYIIRLQEDESNG